MLNFSLKRLQGPEGTIRNKDDLLFVTGHRSFMTQPIFSTDEPHADKHKLERFLHPGRHMAATIYGPICYPALPLLVFRLGTGSNGRPEMVATGATPAPPHVHAHPLDLHHVVLSKCTPKKYSTTLYLSTQTGA